MNIAKIVINKNRGWRGLAKVTAYSTEKEIKLQMVFSFSQEVWNDLMDGIIVVQDEENYYVLDVDHTEVLPQGHQRSVLIKNFIGNVTNVVEVKKTEWTKSTGKIYAALVHFKKNANNHTTSDWNFIGVRVLPEV